MGCILIFEPKSGVFYPECHAPKTGTGGLSLIYCLFRIIVDRPKVMVGTAFVHPIVGGNRIMAKVRIGHENRVLPCGTPCLHTLLAFRPSQEPQQRQPTTSRKRHQYDHA